MGPLLMAAIAAFAPPALGIFTAILMVYNGYSDDLLGPLVLVSLFSCLLGLMSLGSIIAVASVSKGNRKILLGLFKPLLKLIQFATVALVASHTFTITVSALLLETILIGRVHFILIGLLALAGAWASLRVLWFSLTGFKVAEPHVIGKRVRRSDQPKLWAMIDEVCEVTNSEKPENIILGLSPNFFVTESSVSTHDGKFSGKTLYLSLPFSRLLSATELKGIIAHEMGHFIGGDTQFSQKFFPLYKGMSETVSFLANQVGGENSSNIGGLALFPSLAINTFFLDQFSRLESEISRKRELAADEVAIRAYGSQTFARALIKAHAYGAFWSHTEDAMISVLAEGQEIINSSYYFERFVKRIDMEKVHEMLGEFRVEHPTDSHPTLSSRLSKLNFDLNIEVLKAIQNEGESDVASYISDVDLIEEELTKIENEKLIQLSRIYAEIRRSQRKASANERKEEHIFVVNEMLRKMLVLTVLIDGKIEADERSRMALVYEKVTGEGIDQNEFIADINTVNDWNEPLFDMLRGLSGGLNKEVKELLIKASIMVACADGNFADEEYRLVHKFAGVLGLSEYDLKKLFEYVFDDHDDKSNIA